jgi:hypothetical protein
MKLYITPGSPYARIARIVVLEKQLKGRVEIVVAQTRSVDSPYYRIVPSGRVLYLVRDDGVGLEESSVTKVGTFSQALMDEAKLRAWTVISMKNDWRRIFAFE